MYWLKIVVVCLNFFTYGYSASINTSNITKAPYQPPDQFIHDTTVTTTYVSSDTVNGNIELTTLRINSMPSNKTTASNNNTNSSDNNNDKKLNSFNGTAVVVQQNINKSVEGEIKETLEDVHDNGTNRPDAEKSELIDVFDGGASGASSATTNIEEQIITTTITSTVLIDGFEEKLDTTLHHVDDLFNRSLNDFQRKENSDAATTTIEINDDIDDLTSYIKVDENFLQTAVHSGFDDSYYNPTLNNKHIFEIISGDDLESENMSKLEWDNRLSSTDLHVNDDANVKVDESGDLMPILRFTFWNGSSYNCSINITGNGTSFFVPPDAFINGTDKEELNITWKSSNELYNNSLCFDIDTGDAILQLLRGDQLLIYKNKDRFDGIVDPGIDFETKWYRVITQNPIIRLEHGIVCKLMFMSNIIEHEQKRSDVYKLAIMGCLVGLSFVILIIVLIKIIKARKNLEIAV